MHEPVLIGFVATCAFLGLCLIALQLLGPLYLQEDEEHKAESREQFQNRCKLELEAVQNELHRIEKLGHTLSSARPAGRKVWLNGRKGKLNLSWTVKNIRSRGIVVLHQQIPFAFDVPRETRLKLGPPY